MSLTDLHLGAIIKGKSFQKTKQKRKNVNVAQSNVWRTTGKCKQSRLRHTGIAPRVNVFIHSTRLPMSNVPRKI